MWVKTGFRFQGLPGNPIEKDVNNYTSYRYVHPNGPSDTGPLFMAIRLFSNDSEQRDVNERDLNCRQQGVGN
jgi:hypothetical protein